MLDRRAVIAGLAGAVPLIAAPARAAPSTRHGFNDAEIDWQLFDQGLAKANAVDKPILLLAHATWCPHCLRTKKVYDDPLVVRRVRHFVPILVDIDQQPEISARFAPDGNYVPRHIALMPDGTHMADVTGPYEQARYMVPYNQPEWLQNFLWYAWDGFNRRKARRR